MIVFGLTPVVTDNSRFVCELYLFLCLRKNYNKHYAHKYSSGPEVSMKFILLINHLLVFLNLYVG